MYSDGPLFPEGRPVLLFGMRGAVGMELVAEGPSRNVHSGNFGGVVPNPVLELWRDAFGVAPLDVPRLAGTTPDYVFTKIPGIQSIVVPLAPHDESNHAPNESTTISLYLTGIRAAGAIFAALVATGRMS